MERYIKGGKLVVIPKKIINKKQVFNIIVQSFQMDYQYSENEVNEILKSYHNDYALLRRYLIDFNFITRTCDGKIYERK